MLPLFHDSSHVLPTFSQAFPAKACKNVGKARNSEFIVVSTDFPDVPGETSNLENYYFLGGFKIQLIVKKEHPWEPHFDKKLYVEAS